MDARRVDIEYQFDRLADPHLVQVYQLLVPQQGRPTNTRRDDERSRDLCPRELTRVRAAGKRLVDAYQEALLSLAELRQRMPQLRSKEIAVRTQLEAIDARLAAQASYLKLAETLESFLGQLRQATASASALHPPEVLRLVVREVLVGPDPVLIRHSRPVSGPDPPPGYLLRGERHRTALGHPIVGRDDHPSSITPAFSHLFTASTGRHRSLAAWTRTCSWAWWPGGRATVGCCG